MLCKRTQTTRSPINALTMGMIRANDATAKLKVKAAEARNLLPVFLHILQSYIGIRTERDRLRFRCAEHLYDVYKHMEAFSAESPRRLREAATLHLHTYALLAAEACNQAAAARKPWHLWKIVPKHHLFDHCISRVEKTGNPRESWCYADESEMYKAKKIAESGLHVNKLTCIVMIKYSLDLKLP